MTDDTLALSRWPDVLDALRHKRLRQALYDEGAVVMADCLLTLHGEPHRERRRLENRLFRRSVFEAWENELLTATLDATLAPAVAAGQTDLVVLGYRLAMSLTAHIAGIDHDATDAEATEGLYAVVKHFSEGATLVHSTRDKGAVRAEVAATLERFDAELLQPAIARRRALLAACDGTAVPHDVLTTLLRNQDRLELPAEVVRREIAFYLQAGAHSTANAFTHTVDQLLTWGETHPADLATARADKGVVQRAVHETLRLWPASPVAWRRAVADTTVAGRPVPAGTLVVLDLMAANRDPGVWGADADRFDLGRTVPVGLWPWGLSFGAGMHACIGQELDGGIVPDTASGDAAHLFGTVAVMAHAVLAHGAGRDPAAPPVLDPNSVRRHFSSYPIVFGAGG